MCSQQPGYPERRLPAATLVCLLALFLVAGGLYAQDEQEALSLDLYRARLSAANDALATGSDLDAVKRSLAEIEAVRWPDGAILAIEPLLADSDDRDAARARLQTVLVQLDAAANEPVEARLAQLEVVRQRLALDRPSFWQRIWRWISDFVDALLPDRLPRGGANAARLGSRLLVWSIVLSGGLLVVFVLSYWLRGFVGGILWDRAQRRVQDSALPQTSLEARNRAQALAGGGNYREAVRQLYLAAVLHLDEIGLLQLQRDQTNREVLAQLPADLPIRRQFEPVVDTFDRVWYGLREPDQSTFDAYRRSIDTLMAQTAGEGEERARV